MQPARNRQQLAQLARGPLPALPSGAQLFVQVGSSGTLQGGSGGELGILAVGVAAGLPLSLPAAPGVLVTRHATAGVFPPGHHASSLSAAGAETRPGSLRAAPAG